MKRKNIFISTISIIMLSAFMFSCTKSLEPKLTSNKEIEGAINTIDDLLGIINGAYNEMSKRPYYGRDFILYGEVRSDNCFSNGWSGRITSPFKMEMISTDPHPTDTWESIYKVISNANLVISKEKATLSGGIEDKKRHIVGQAYAIRALAHFDALKLFGQQHVTEGNNVGIPYIKIFHPENEKLLVMRNTVDEVRKFIYEDLNMAKHLMIPTAAKVPVQNMGKTYLSNFAVQAIKARVAIYFGDSDTAMIACKYIIDDPKSGFEIVQKSDFVSNWTKKQPKNSIFELAASSVDNNSINGLQYIYRGTSYGDVRAQDTLLSIFDPTDVRITPNMIGREDLTRWGGQKYLTNYGKYPSSDYSDNIFLFRFEELILNYAEALLNKGNEGEALVQLNRITAQRDATEYKSPITIEDILKERRRELCFEGFRFDDLARMHRDIPSHSDRKKIVTYGSYNYAFPIPQRETNANSNLQPNIGYKQ